MHAASVLEGVLERVTFTNEENGWSVVKLSVAGRSDLVTAVGPLLGAQAGENLRVTGSWTLDKKYGEQFRVSSYVTLKPATLVGIEKYLGSGMVKGLGKVMAERLVKHFGLETLDVIDRTPERLTEVEGIGPVRSRRIQSAWVEQRQIQDVMVFLQSYGVSTAYAIRIYKEYRDRAVSIVQENPYRLAIDIRGIGFKTADRIASQLGIEPTSPRRAEAGVLHTLGALSDEGHVFYPRDGLVAASSEMLAIDASIVETALDALVTMGQLVVEEVDAGRGVFLKSLHVAESGAAQRMRQLACTRPKAIVIDVDKAIAWFEGQQRLELAEEQRAAIRAAVDTSLLVITGGPGTGKTTLVNGIIRILEKKGRRILLAAPTGRAAKRMAETTEHEAKTIHRLLEFSPKHMGFQRNADNALDADVLIVDEASMIDTVLAYNLLKAIPLGCQLILVGDVDQLPSVGPGSVLKDVMASGMAKVVRLRQIFRQASRSLIVVNAHRVNEGLFPEMHQEDAQADFFYVERNEPEEILTTLAHLVRERIPAKFGFDPIDGIQVLTPMHRGALGASAINAQMQALLNPVGDAVTRGTRMFRVGDKVMQVRNNYDLDVYNGDIGRVRSIDPIEQELKVEIDRRQITYDYEDLDELVLAYACSIHKSQGSEYPCVVIPLHTQHYMMLQRNLLYTGITRGRRLVVLLGSKRALAIAVKNDTIAARHTYLAQRLRRSN